MKKLRNFIYISLGAGAVATVLRIFGVIFAFDKDVEYFDVKSPICIAAFAVMFLSLALAVLIGIMWRGRLEIDAKFSKKIEKPSFLLGATLLAHSVYTLYETLVTKNAWGILGIVFGIASAVYFLGTFIGSKDRSAYSMLGGFAFVFWCAYVLAVNYFDVYTTLNNPIKLSMQVALIAAMFCLIFEFRVHLGGEKREAHLIFSLFAASLGAYFSIPTIICYILDKTQNPRYFLAAVVVIAISIYGACVSLMFGEADLEKDVDEIEDDNTEVTTEEEING